MSDGMNDEFEKLISSNPELACQLRNMTQTRIRDIRGVTFNNVSPQKLSDEDVLKFGLDYFASIANGQQARIIDDLRKFAQERGIAFNEEAIAKDIEDTVKQYRKYGFPKSLDKASDEMRSPKECHMM